VIVSKTPLRIPLAGGLSDLRPYAERFGGATVSSTIDRYIYVVLKNNPEGRFDLTYRDAHERARTVEGIRHDLIREALTLSGMQRTPVHLSILADLASESGLGSSGALTVGLLGAMGAHLGRSTDPAALLADAARIEVDILQGASGYHDPSICALGGLKLLEYREVDGEIAVSGRDIAMDDGTRRAFEDSLLFFYSGRHARTKPSLDLLTSHFEGAVEVLHDIKALAYELEAAFGRGDLQRIGEIIGEKQQLKQRLPGMFVNDYVLDVTRRVGEVGAYAQLPGGKISAFVIVCCPDGQQAQVRSALADLTEVRFGLEASGTKVVAI
jgi:D-glycero-alpha-D-manno-heptose-7-phosphate kinase